MEPLLLVSMIALWIMTLVNLLLTLRVVHWLRSVAAMQSREAEREDQPDLMVGAPAPDFTARTLDGQPVSLARYAGRGVVFIFISTQCGSCQSALPMLARLALRAREHAGVELVLVSDAAAAETRDWLGSFHAKTGLQVELPVLVPGHRTTTLVHEYNPRGLFPFFCYVDEHGTVQARDPLEQGQWAALKRSWEGAVEPKVAMARASRFR